METRPRRTTLFMGRLSLLLLAIGFLASAAASPAPAAPTLYYSRAGFLADGRVTTTSTVDFDGFAVGEDLTGDTLQGVTFGAPGGSPLTVIQAATGVRYSMSTSSSPNVLSPGGSNAGWENDDLELTFATPVRAAGLDVVFDAPDGASYVALTFYDASNAVLWTTGAYGQISAPDGAPGYQFVGLVADTSSIKRIVFDEHDDSASDDNVAYDTLTFSPSAVPEPATLLLLGSGLAGVLGLRRRKA